MTGLDKLRKRQIRKSLPPKLAVTFLMMLFGCAMSMFAVFLECASAESLPQWLTSIDIRSFSVSLLPWVFMALPIALFARTPLRAAVNVGAFFSGKWIGRLVYLSLITHTQLAWDDFRFWLIFTAVSPLIAVVCWYGRGVGASAGFAAALIISFFFLYVFHFTSTFREFGFHWQYGFLPLIFLAVAIGMLWRRPLQSLFSVLGGFALAYIYVLLPFSIPVV